MTNKLASVLFAAIAACSSCATTTTKPILTKLTAEVDCSAEKVKSQLPVIITDVATDLLSKDYVGLLIDLAKRVGDDVVTCGVALAATAADARASAHPGYASPNAGVIAENATAYLTARDVHFASPMAAVCLPACPPPGVCRYVPPKLNGVCFK